jgi:hypothetical protein
MFPSADTSACSPLPSSGYRGRSLRKPCGSPPSQVLRVRKTARPSVPVASGFPWRLVPPMVRRRWGALLGSWEILLKACPELGTPAIPAQPRNIGPPDAAFRLVNGVGIATSRVFGAEPSRPASLLCTLRTHQSPGEWQHSLPACLLDCGRAGLTPAGFHQEVSPSHLRFLLFQTFPSAMTMSARVKHYSSALLHALKEERHFALVDGVAFPTVGSLVIVFQARTQSDPCISSVATSIMITTSNSPA